MNNEYETYILAFGPHPDDVDIGCGGVLWQSAQDGKSNRIIDCTPSQYATRGTCEERLDEAQKAGQILGVASRENLMLHDCQLLDDDNHRHLFATKMRQYKPEIVLVPHQRDRHPDHAILGSIVYAGSFLSGLASYECLHEGVALAPHRPRLFLQYTIWNDCEPDCIMACSTDAFDAKFAAFQAYHTQNPTNDHAFDYFRSKAKVLGFRIRQPFGEGFSTMGEKIGVANFDALLSGYW